jgi:hypothetical protein
MSISPVILRCCPCFFILVLRPTGADPVSRHLSAYLQMAVLLHFPGAFLFLHVFCATGVSVGSVGVARHITARSLRPWVGRLALCSGATPLCGSGVLCLDVLFRDVRTGSKSVLPASLGRAVIFKLQSFSYISNGRGRGECECAATAFSESPSEGQIVMGSECRIVVLWGSGPGFWSGVS